MTTSSGTMTLATLALAFLMPYRTARALAAVFAFHIDASESRNGNTVELLAATITLPIHIALSRTLNFRFSHLCTSVSRTL